MSRIEDLFTQKKENVLNVFFTAGYPALEDTLPIMKSLQEAGADMIELGMPYSDPLADGPIIQSSSAVALANGMTIKKLFEQLGALRKEISIPVLLMGYMNPVLQYGFDSFCRDAKKSGVDGLIIPDLPIFEFVMEFGSILKKYELDFVFLVTPETSEERLKQLDQLSSGFLYAVSSSSTTGTNSALEVREEYFNRLKDLDLKNPVLIGFGIKDKFSFQKACSFARGAIIGTAFIKALENAEPENIPSRVNRFINSLK